MRLSNAVLFSILLVYAVPASIVAGTSGCHPFPSNSFYPEANVPVLVTGDWNGDGIPDLAMVSRAGLVVFIGRGDGTFKQGATYGLGSPDFTQGAVAGDFNHDGKLDIAIATSPAVAGHGSYTVNVFLGNGDGTFQAPRKSTVQTVISFLAAGDFNHDGNLDLVGISYDAPGTPPLEVLLGKGDGTFQPAADYPVTPLSWAVTVADLNGDGILDLAVSNTGSLEAPPEFASHTVSVFLGKGDGTFGPAAIFNTGKAPIGIIAADFNGDGKTDLATANYISGTASVLLGNGDGTFAAPVSYVTGHPYSPYYLAAMPFGGEQPGLAVSGLAGVFTLRNKGDGTFRIAEGYNPGGGGSLVTADFNGDGKADVALGAGEGVSATGIAILLGTGTGGFITSSAYVAVPDLTDVAEGDFNGDGILDLAVGSPDNDQLGIMLGNGMGGFGAVINLYSLPQGAEAIAAGDVNGDGKLDLAVGLNSGVVQMLLGNGDGSFAAGGSFPLYQGSPPAVGGIAFADFNGDGALDMAVLSPGAFNGSPGVVSIFLGSGNGAFQAAVPYAVEPTLQAVDLLEGLVIGDFNGDGIPDFAVGDNALGMVRVFLGNGDGTFRAGPETTVPTPVEGLTAADFNGDGKLDLAVALFDSVQILLGQGDGSFHQGTAVSGAGGWVSAADFNGDGKTDIAAFLDGIEMLFFAGKGDGSFEAGVPTYTAVGPYQAVAGDLTGSGYPDLVTAGSEGGAVAVLLNRCGGK